MGFPDGSDCKNICLQCRLGFSLWVGKILWRRASQPMPVFLPGEFHGQRRLSGYSPQHRKELDMTEWLTLHFHFSVQFSSVAQSCPTLCDSMNRSTPGLPVHHHLPEFTQTHVHWVRDAIQPFHSRSSPSPPAPNPSQHQSLFQWVNSSHEVAKVLEFQLQPSVLPKKSQGWSPSEWTGGSPCSPRDSQESSPTPQFKSINSSALSLLHSPTLTSIHNHWKNHSLT